MGQSDEVYSTSKLGFEEDDILSDISNLRISTDKFNQVIGSSPPIYTDSLRNLGKSSLLGCSTNFQLPSPSKSGKWDMPFTMDDYPRNDYWSQPPSSSNILQPRSVSPVRSDNTIAMESILFKQNPAVQISNFSSIPADSSSARSQLDLSFPTFPTAKSASFSSQSASSNPQAEIEMLKRQLELANRKIDQIQTQYGHNFAESGSEFMPAKGFVESPILLSDNNPSHLDQFERRDSLSNNFNESSLKSYSPGTYAPNIWSNSGDTAKGKKYDKWYQSTTPVIGNTRLYSIKPTTKTETPYNDSNMWTTADLSNPGIYEPSFQSRGFTPKPQPDPEPFDSTPSQDVSSMKIHLFEANKSLDVLSY